MKSRNQNVYKSAKFNNRSMHPGDLKRSPDESFFSGKTIVFVDEGFLNELSKHFGRGNYLRFDKILFSESLCKKQKLACLNQKGVDVLLAIDLINVPIAFPEVKKVILVSSDSDFVPIIKQLENSGIKTILYTFYEKKRNTGFSRSNDLIKSVHKYALLKKEDFNFPLK
jgi:uncharacterized LabA/DUF88 family protein